MGRLRCEVVTVTRRELYTVENELCKCSKQPGSILQQMNWGFDQVQLFFKQGLNISLRTGLEIFLYAFEL